MGWYTAPSLQRLGKQVDATWPGRDARSDGTIGDADHWARGGDHVPDPRPNGVVRARDIDSTDIAAMVLVLAAIAHPATNYVIYAGSIWLRSYGFRRRVYTGANGHYGHVHVSILHTQAAENSTAAWLGGAATSASHVPDALLKPTRTTEDDDEMTQAQYDALTRLIQGYGKRIENVEAELVERRDGRLGNDLRKAHDGLRGGLWNLFEHFAGPGDKDRAGRPQPAGGRFYQLLAGLVRR